MGRVCKNNNKQAMISHRLFYVSLEKSIISICSKILPLNISFSKFAYIIYITKNDILQTFFFFCDIIMKNSSLCIFLGGIVWKM